MNNTCKIVKPDTQVTNGWDKIDGGTAVAYFRQIANILNVDVPNMDCIGMVLLQPASLDKPLEFVVWVVECLSNPAFKIRLTDLEGKTKKELEDLVYVLQGHAHNTSRKNKQPPSQATRNIVSQVLRTLTQYSTPGTDFILSSANATDRKSRSKIPIVNEYLYKIVKGQIREFPSKLGAHSTIVGALAACYCQIHHKRPQERPRVFSESLPRLFHITEGSIVFAADATKATSTADGELYGFRGAKFKACSNPDFYRNDRKQAGLNIVAKTLAVFRIIVAIEMKEKMERKDKKVPFFLE